MGNLLPTPTNPSDTENPTPSSSPTPQSTQTEEQSPESKTQDPAMDDPKTLENQEKSIDTEEKEVASEEGEEEEEDGECGFCIYMKGGGCKETFTAWEDCVKKNKGDDVVDKCFEITGALKECMEAHSDYYSPVLRAEKAVAEEEEAVRELEREFNAEEGSVVSSDDRSSSMEEEGSKGSATYKETEQRNDL